MMAIRLTKINPNLLKITRLVSKLTCHVSLQLSQSSLKTSDISITLIKSPLLISELCLQINVCADLRVEVNLQPAR